MHVRIAALEANNVLFVDHRNPHCDGLRTVHTHTYRIGARNAALSGHTIVTAQQRILNGCSTPQNGVGVGCISAW